MLPLRHAHAWRIANILLMLLVLAATLMPASWLFGDREIAVPWFPHADKWLHGLTFAVLALWYAGQYRPRSYWRIVIGLMAFGVLVELCQLMVGYRTADWLDIGANGAGIIAGLAVATAGAGGWCLRVEEWQAVRQTGT